MPRSRRFSQRLYPVSALAPEWSCVVAENGASCPVTSALWGGTSPPLPRSALTEHTQCPARVAHVPPGAEARRTRSGHVQLCLPLIMLLSPAVSSVCVFRLILRTPSGVGVISPPSLLKEQARGRQKFAGGHRAVRPQALTCPSALRGAGSNSPQGDSTQPPAGTAGLPACFVTLVIFQLKKQYPHVWKNIQAGQKDVQ